MFRRCLLVCLLAFSPAAGDERKDSFSASDARCQEKSAAGEQGYNACMLEKEAGMAAIVDTFGTMMPGLASTCRRQFPDNGFKQADCMMAALDSLGQAGERRD